MLTFLLCMLFLLVLRCDYYQCVPPDPGIAAAALGASESDTLLGTAPAEALHTFTLDSGALCWFFRDSTTLTPLPTPVLVRLANPSGCPVVARSSTVLPCSAVSASLTALASAPCLPCIEGRQLLTPPRFPRRLLPHRLSTWTFRLQLREQFRQNILVLRLHSDRGGLFSSDLLRDFCCGEGIRLSFTLPDSPQQNGIAERRIGLVMEVARTFMIHAVAPHFLWPFSDRYAVNQLNLWPCVSLPETSPTLHWTGEVGNASVFRVWGSRAFVRDTSADKLLARAILCVFLGFVLHTPGWQYYPPTLRRVFPSHDVTFEESVPFYLLFPYLCAPPPPPPLFLAPGPPPVDPLPPQGPAPSGVSQVDPLPGTVPVEVAVGSGAAPGAASGGAAIGGLRVWSLGVLSLAVLSLGVLSKRVRSLGVLSLGVLLRLEVLLVIRRDYLRNNCVSGLFGAHAFGVELPELDARDAGAGGAGVTAGANGTGGTMAAGPGGARTRGTGAARTVGVWDADGAGAGGNGAAGAGAVDPRAGGAGGTVQPRLYFAVLQSVVSLHLVLSYLFTLLVLFLIRVLGTHAMAHRPSSVPLHVPLPTPPECSLPDVSNPESGRARAANPTVSCLLATAVTDPSFDSPSVRDERALGTDVLEDRREDFECLAAAVPCFASMLLAPEGDPDAPDIPTPRSYVEAITGPYSYQWQAAMDAKMESCKSTGTYVDEVPPLRVNIVEGMWIFRVKRPPGSPPAFKARYVARAFSQPQAVD
ncbi:unnamed protein product [Closterium sp. NIES-54]